MNISWQSTILPGYGPGGKPILSVLAKRTYSLAMGAIALAPQQQPLNQADIPADPQNPFHSELLAENELIPFKPYTDFIVHCKAHAPHGKKAYHLDCEVHAGALSKKITVYGERHLESKALRGLCFSEPIPFECQPVGYCGAYGGNAVSKEGMVFSYPPNPLGRGFNLKGGFKDYADLPVPFCEDPSSPIMPDSCILNRYDDWPQCPKPASFGFTRPIFYPRYTYAGILPEMVTADQTADPKNPRLDFRFYQSASPGLGEQILTGRELIKLVYMDRNHPLFEFELPGKKPVLSITVDGSVLEVAPVLQTVFIDKEQGCMSMIWRGVREYGGVAVLADTPFGYSCTD